MKLRIALPAAMAMVLATGLAAPLRAQGIENRAVQGPVVKPPGTIQRSNAPPPGLPGASVDGDRVTPSNPAASDLPPTEALFDAINRGDLTAARDAIARGADYNGRNILGLTPLDQSIDLSRNNITFLLLSLRGASPETVQSAKTLVGSSKAPAPANGKAPPAALPRAAAAKPVVAPAIGGPAVLATARSPQPLPQGPVDRGTPSPQNGFLGFGG